MRKIITLSMLFVLVPMLVSLQWREGNRHMQDLQIAFLADVHFHDVYADFSDTEYRGIKNPENGKYATIRTMQSQLNSTRLFNENYFAFLAALDDLARRGIKYVIMPGDFSDDGQPVHLEGLKKILDHYETDHGMQFFLTTGNHDPVRPFDREGGKSDFLGAGGMPQPVMSIQGLYDHNPRTEHNPVITRDIRQLGYMEIVELLGDFGFYPDKEYRYWETPFSTYDQATYSFSKAKKAGELENRTYLVPTDDVPALAEVQAPRGGVPVTSADVPAVAEVQAPTGGVPVTAEDVPVPAGEIPVPEEALAPASPHTPTDGVPVPDVSYLVEPANGLWLLAIDANVYIPQKNAEEAPLDPANYTGASIGYNNVMSHKQHLIDWIKSVMERAERLHKTVVVFSHYPMVDFHDDATHEIGELLKGNKMQNHRIPAEEVAETFADAGIRVHFGGHIHINDTGIRTSKKGNRLVNIQIPSLAAYIPAYKLLTVREGHKMEIETIVLDSVPRFDELFGLYSMEHAWMEKQANKETWNDDILQTDNYRDYTAWHLKELVQLRFLPGEWPREFTDNLVELTGEQILELAISLNHSADMDSKRKLLAAYGVQATALREWNGMDLIYDLYRLRSADKLALDDIGASRIRQYQMIMELSLNSPPTEDANKCSSMHPFKKFASIFVKFLNGAPANHFSIDARSGELLEN